MEFPKGFYLRKEVSCLKVWNDAIFKGPPCLLTGRLAATLEQTCKWFHYMCTAV